MKVQEATFVKSALRPDDYPRDERPEIAFVGRSNVGKSTLMNTLLGRKGLAKTSSTPGKTQLINFFNVNDQIYFVDLPGYGYAKVAKAMKARWNRFMMGYLAERPSLRLVVQLIDSRHGPSAKDLDMLDLLDRAEVPTLIVATKVDKLKRSLRVKSMNLIRTKLDLDEEALVIPFSSVTKEGKSDVWRVIDDVCG